MITLDNPFLIRNSQAVQVENPAPDKWMFQVAENGCLAADFLQTTHDLDVCIRLSGSGANCDINCAYLLNKNNKIKIDIHVIHECERTSSVQRIQGLATDQARVDFNGTITIPRDSQKCDGRQNHRAIVLSDQAVVSATPQLEIWADDVQCAHGSAVGPLDKNQLFYMQTRGVPVSEAKKILLSAFFNDLMPAEFDPLIQDWITRYV